MRIAYHPTGAALTSYALNAWITTSLAAWPTVTGGTLVTLPNPQHPIRIESDTAGDDRETLGGSLFSKIKYTRRSAALTFIVVASDDISAWRTFYAATKGFRLPFIFEHPLTLALIVMIGGQEFPFNQPAYGRHEGAVKWVERI